MAWTMYTWLDSVVRDARLAVRVFRRDAMAAAAAIVSIALAVGACLAALSIVNALILRPLPVADPGQLVSLAFPTDSAERPEGNTFNDPLFAALREAARGRADLFAMSTQVLRPAILGASGEKEDVRTQFVTGDAFGRLGVRPMRGRLIVPEDDGLPGAMVAVVSHAFWMRRLGGDAAAVGRSLAIAARQYEIVGVAAAGFDGIEPGRPTDVWLPYGTYNPRAFGNPAFNWFHILGRLTPGSGPDTLQPALQPAFSNFRRDHAALYTTDRNRGQFLAGRIRVHPAATGISPLRTQYARALWILMAIAGLVLLIAGANVGNLLLARAASREHEMAVRVSIGAGRRRLMQQVLVESAMLAGFASILGALFAATVAPIIVGMLASPDDPVRLDLRADGRLLVAAAALALALAAILGAAPAFRAFRTAPIAFLKTGARTSAGTGVMRAFVAAQIAFALVVLFAGGWLVLSFTRLTLLKPGFAVSHVWVVNVETASRIDPVQERTRLLAIVDAVRAAPGVETAGAAEFGMLGRAWTQYIRRPGPDREQIEVTFAPVGDGFFETMEIPLLAGRSFRSGDMTLPRGAPIVVNDAFARSYFGDRPAVGEILEGRFDGTTDTLDRHEIVGVAADARYDVKRAPAPVIYFPLRTRGAIHVRAAGDPDALVPMIRERVRAADPLFRVTTVTSQAALVGRTLLRERMLALLSGFFAAVGFALVAIGVYAVLAYSVVRRTREIGIRMALGAPARRILSTLAQGVGGAVAAGVVVGAIGAAWAWRFVASLLFEVSGRDVLSMALPLGTLAIALTFAAAVPALRVLRLDAVTALRHE
jgi:predicted permease